MICNDFLWHSGGAVNISVPHIRVVPCIGKQITATNTHHSGREIRILRLINVAPGDNEFYARSVPNGCLTKASKLTCSHQGIDFLCFLSFYQWGHIVEWYLGSVKKSSFTHFVRSGQRFDFFTANNVHWTEQFTFIPFIDWHHCCSACNWEQFLLWFLSKNESSKGLKIHHGVGYFSRFLKRYHFALLLSCNGCR